MPRRQRFDHGRNLQNLRVIPTTLNKSSPIVATLNPSHRIYTLVQNQVVQPAVVPIPKQNQGMTSDSVAVPRQNQSLPSASTVRPVLNQFKHQQPPPALPTVNSNTFRKRRNRKSRRRGVQESSYQWYDSYNLKQVGDPVIDDFEKAINVSEVKVENVPEAEVRNVTEAKVENSSKAKIENASEAKVENASEAKVENASEAKVENEHESPTEENDFEEVEVASVEGEAKEEVLVGYRKTKRQYLSYKKKKCFFRPKIFNLGERTFVNCMNMHDDVDVDVVSEAEYEYENDNFDKNESQEEKFLEIKESDDKANKVKVETGTVPAKNVKVPKTILRKYKTCIESSKELTQGECLIQSSLDTWKSHLLGLEYLVEIQNENKDAILKYNCILCDKDVSFQGLPAIYVMNHVNDRQHVVRYLEKHFSAYGFKCAESDSYHTDALKKIAEEVNLKLGYYFMCVTTSAHYTKNKQDFKEIIKSAYHPNEKDVKLDKTLIEKALNYLNLEEIKNIISDIIGRIEHVVENDKVCSGEAVDKSQTNLRNATSLEDNDGIKDCDKKSESSNFQFRKKKNKFNASKAFLTGTGKFSTPIPKGKGKIAFSSYLKSKYAKAAMYKKPLKGYSSRFNKESEKNDPDEMDSSQVAGDSTEQSVEKADAMATEEVSQTSVEESVKADVDSKETKVNSTECDSGQHAHKNREKVPLKASTVHSKHCRKRILGKENSRSKVASKTSTKEELTSDVSDKLNDSYKSVSHSSDHTSRKVNKRHDSIRHDKTASRSSQKKSSPHRHLSAHKIKEDLKIIKVSKDLKSSGEKHISSHKITSKKNVEESSSKQIKVTKDSPAEWRPIAITKSLDKSPISGTSPLPKSPPRKSVKKRSKSPIRRIKSPLRHVIKEPLKNPVRRHSRSPLGRKSKSPIWKPAFQSGLQGARTPVRRKSRSPLWKPSRSPIRRKSRSPRRRFSRSPGKRYSRSPVRRRSRTPIRRQSKSPKRRYSRSPRRRHSRSPVRRNSRSPVRRHSRSPLRRRSRSPVKRRSRSPVRRRSRSSGRRYSRSPIRKHSRSPLRRYSRSPIRKHSRSPLRRYSRSPMHKLSKSPPKYRSLRESISPNRRQGRFDSPSLMYSYDKLSDSTKSEFSKIRGTSKILNEIKGVRSEYKSHQYSSSSTHGIGDLDPVSDEDESVYFNDKHQADAAGSSSTKIVLAKLLQQKFSMADVKPNDPAVNKLMQFMESHSSEIQELMGSHSKSGNTNVSKVDTNVLGQNLLLQQYLLSNLAGFNQERALAATAVASNLQSNFPQQSFLQSLSGFGLNIPPNVTPNPNIPTNVASNIPTNVAPNVPTNVPSNIPTNIPPPNVSQPVQRFFPPNINVPPPQIFHQPNPPRQNFPPKPNVPPEVMFKDLKATVNKLFGANEGVRKQEKMKPQVPGYVTEPDPEKWDLNHPDTQKFNPSKNVFQPLGKNIEFGGMPKNLAREEIPVFNNNNNPGQFFPGRGMNRSQIPIPPPDAKVSFCDVSRGSKGNLFPVVNNPLVNPNFSIDPRAYGGVSDVKLSLAQRLASVLVKFGMIDVPAPLLQEMLMKIGAFSSSPRQDINESEIISILKRLGYLS